MQHPFNLLAKGEVMSIESNKARATANVQIVAASDVSVPFGGYKQSGWSYEYGWKGIEAYLQSKSVFADLA